MMKPDEKLSVLLDLDSTVYNLLHPWLDLVHQHFDERYDETFIDDWSWCKKTRAGAKPVLDLLGTPGLFLNLKPFAGAIEAIREVAEWDDVEQYFASTIVGPTAAWEKMQAVDRDFDFMGGSKRLLMTGGIKAFVGDALVDDAGHNLEEFAARGGIAVKANFHPQVTYAKDALCDAELTDWNDYPDLVEKMIVAKREYLKEKAS